MQLSPDGKITIPPDIRSLAGLLPGTDVEFKFDNGRVWLSKVPPSAATQRQQMLALIEQAKGCATANRGMNTDAVMQLTRGD